MAGGRAFFKKILGGLGILVPLDGPDIIGGGCKKVYSKFPYIKFVWG